MSLSNSIAIERISESINEPCIRQFLFIYFIFDANYVRTDMCVILLEIVLESFIPYYLSVAVVRKTAFLLFSIAGMLLRR